TPQIHVQTGVTYYTPAFTADPGDDFALNSAPAVLTRAGNRFFELLTGAPYNPADKLFVGPSYTLTAPDGTVYQLDAAGRVTEQVMPGRSPLFFSDSGITSATGDVVRFINDDRGRMERLIGTDGTQVKYDYDGNGNLVAVHYLAVGEARNYAYRGSSPHQLTLLTGIAGQAGAVI